MTLCGLGNRELIAQCATPPPRPHRPDRAAAEDPRTPHAVAVKAAGPNGVGWSRSTARSLIERLPSASSIDGHPAAGPCVVVVTGRYPRTDVPAPGLDTTASVPPRAPMRSAIPSSPVPPCGAVGSKPAPSSVTENAGPPSRTSSATTAAAVGACLAVFCSASRQVK